MVAQRIYTNKLRESRCAHREIDSRLARFGAYKHSRGCCATFQAKVPDNSRYLYLRMGCFSPRTPIESDAFSKDMDGRTVHILGTPKEIMMAFVKMQRYMLSKKRAAVYIVFSGTVVITYDLLCRHIAAHISAFAQA